MPHPLSYRIGTLDQPHLPFAQVAEMGIQGLELVWRDATTTDQAGTALESSGLRVTSLHANCPLEDDSLPGVLGEIAAQAADLGAAYLFVSLHAGDTPKPEAFERIRRLGDAVGEHQVYLAMETHPDLCQNAANMLETMAGVNHPWVGINFDTANLHYYSEGLDTEAELRQVASHVRGVHLKDTFGGYRDGDFPVFGEGIVDFAAVDRILTEAGYTGACTMELEGGTFDTNQPEDLAAKVAQCVAHLRRAGVVAE